MLRRSASNLIDFVASGDVVEVGAFAAARAIVGSAAVVDLEVLFDPLAELQVVKILGLDKLLDLESVRKRVLHRCGA